MTRRRVVRTVALLVAVLGVPVAVGVAADASWKTHRDDTCGIELKYPPAYTIDASGASDFCAAWIRIGVKEPRGLRALFSLHVDERDRAERARATKPGQPVSVRDFALYVATNQCTADGADGSTHCENGEVRSTFKTAQGFRVFEIYMTEVNETFATKKVEKRRLGPLFALDLSDDEVVRILLADAEAARVDELKAILDTLRVWTKARRQTPKVVEIPSVLMPPQTFTLMVTADESYRTRGMPPMPVTNWFLVDPRGRRLGRDLATGKWIAEAPAITHGTHAGSGFMLRELIEGRYELEVTASVPSVPYQIAVGAPDRSGKPSTARLSGRTSEPGAVDRYEIVYSSASTPAVNVAPARDFSRLTVLLSSRGNVASEALLTDPRGRATGLDPVAKAEHRKIPRSSYLDEGAGQRSMVLDVRQPLDGSYMLQATGTAAGRYSLDLHAWDRSATVSARPEIRDVPTDVGVVHLFRLDYAAGAKTPLKLGGGFNGSAGSADDVSPFLAYANPTSVDTKLRMHVTSFPLVIFYGAGIRPVTFNAMLNGDNISNRFTPEPETFQIVRIPLLPGVNTLVLSVEGTTAAGQTATDTDRLVFRVE